MANLLPTATTLFDLAALANLWQGYRYDTSEVRRRQFRPLFIATVLDEPNRDIMSRLYIGEGTFNRARRRALQGVARALQEMEAAA